LAEQTLCGIVALAGREVVFLRSLLNLGNEHLLRPLDLKIVRRSRVMSFASDPGLEPDARRIAFFHPPKCGGTSVHQWLALTFGGPAGLDPIAAEAAARNLDVPSVKLREAILAYFVERTNARFISGHYNYSVRAFLGHEDEFDLITILRHPLDRTLSNYYYNRFREGRGHFPIKCSLTEWLAMDQARSMARVFTRMFVGDSDTAEALYRHGNCHDIRWATSEAIRNLEKFTIVGTLERLKDFQEAVRQRYALKSSIGHLRKSPRPDYRRFADQPREVQERLLELCEPDIMIYERFAPKPQESRSFEAVPRLAE
jgi:hypothetical protein